MVCIRSQIQGFRVMRSSIANWKENLNKIVLDVHGGEDEEEEPEIERRGGDGQASHFADRRLSHSLAYSRSSAPDSPSSNGIGSPYNSEIEQYKSDIKRLRESEAEIKALSINYAALLKEKEDQIIKLNQEYGSLKQTLDATSSALNASKIEASRASRTGPNMSKGGSDQSPNRLSRHSSGKNRLSANQLLNGVVSKQEGHVNGFTHSLQDDIGSKYSSPMVNEKVADLQEQIESMEAPHECIMIRCSKIIRIRCGKIIR